jgi:hypothetical protein
MPTSDLAGSSSFTIAEILAKLGTGPKTGLNPNELQERLIKYGPTPWSIVKLGLYRILDPAHSWKKSLFEPLRVAVTGTQKAVR